jgi:hypothetical protein
MDDLSSCEDVFDCCVCGERDTLFNPEIKQCERCDKLLCEECVSPCLDCCRKQEKRERRRAYKNLLKDFKTLTVKVNPGWVRRKELTRQAIEGYKLNTGLKEVQDPLTNLKM